MSSTINKEINEKINPLISIVIPIYNEEKTILKCINSVLLQSYSNKEIILVNDGSTDNSINLLNNRNFKIITIPHSGAGKSRNIGCKFAKGEIITFIDSDMICGKYYIEKLTIPILRNKCIGTYSISEKIANKDNLWSKCWNLNIDLPINNRITKKKNNNGKVFRAISRSYFNKTNGFNSKLGYFDDTSLIKDNIRAYPVQNALSYHYNPDNLIDIYFSARWIGRSTTFYLNLKNLIRYSFLNSIRVSYSRIRKGAPISFLLFKIIFDLGILSGLLDRNSLQNFSK